MVDLLPQNLFVMIRQLADTCQKVIYLMFFRWIASSAKNIKPL
jgi:hypothetical protein